MINEINTEEGNKLFVVGLDMDNRSSEEIARDAVMQVNSIVEALMASGYGNQKQTNNNDNDRKTSGCIT